jgi:hypothetical protein
MTQEDVLRGPFDVATHKATFTNYLEVVIAPNGTIVYAVPSHQCVTERMASAKGVNVDECPRERWLDYDHWLMEITGCVCVWTGGYTGKPNDAQRKALEMLREEGLLMYGEERIPPNRQMMRLRDMLDMEHIPWVDGSDELFCRTQQYDEDGEQVFSAVCSRCAYGEIELWTAGM